jgi:hypothetical protein
LKRIICLFPEWLQIVESFIRLSGPGDGDGLHGDVPHHVIVSLL